MTDAEKIARMVDWMGGWPEHTECAVYGYCGRCGAYGYDWPGGSFQCEEWNPFERIEDAFLVVERLPYNYVSIEKWKGVWACVFSDDDNQPIDGAQSPTPARAIAEAAWQVISVSDLDPRRPQRNQ